MRKRNTRNKTTVTQTTIGHDVGSKAAVARLPMNIFSRKRGITIQQKHCMQVPRLRCGVLDGG